MQTFDIGDWNQEGSKSHNIRINEKSVGLIFLIQDCWFWLRNQQWLQVFDGMNSETEWREMKAIWEILNFTTNSTKCFCSYISSYLFVGCLQKIVLRYVQCLHFSQGRKAAKPFQALIPRPTKYFRRIENRTYDLKKNMWWLLFFENLQEVGLGRV